MHPNCFSYQATLSKLEQVFINLINNAKDALKEKEEGILTISTGVRQINEKTMAVIPFQDNGIGMDMAIKEKIFAPFFPPRNPIKIWVLGFQFVML